MSSVHKVLTRQGYVLNKDKLTKKQIEDVKKDLKVMPKSNSNFGGDVESFDIYTETEKGLIVPRYYGISKFGMPDKIKPMNKCKVPTMKFKFGLRENQKPVVEACLKLIEADGKKYGGGGIISLPCGKFSLP
jgi:hypothetical protein